MGWDGLGGGWERYMQNGEEKERKKRKRGEVRSKDRYR